MKKVIGILSIVLCPLILFQSCAAGLSNSLSDSGEISGSAGVLLAIAFIVAGILVLVSKDSQRIIITSIVFYVIAGAVGLANVGSFKDLMIWSVLSFIFAIYLFVFKVLKNPQS